MGEYHYKPEETPDFSVLSFDRARLLVAKHGTPLLICDLERLKGNYRKLKGLVKDVELFYAVKANPLPQVLKTLVKMGSCFDVASKNEISACLEAGAKPENLLYANPIKARESIKFAYDKGVRAFTYDSLLECEKMARDAPGSEVLLRLAVKDIGSICKFSTKFGAHEKYAIELLLKAKDVGLNPTGVSFHVGSQCTRIENYSKALDLCASVFKKAKKKGIDLHTLDIGGGIPIEYTSDVYTFDELSELLNRKICENFEDVRVIMEPGRPMVADIMTLVSRVIGINTRRGRDCIYLDDGVYNSLSEKIFGHCEYRLVSDQNGPLTRYTVFGPTCDSMDVIAKDAYLPELHEGDLVLVPNTGAYTNSAATHFNGFDPAKIIFI
jgi:ornithine decarboxylase